MEPVLCAVCGSPSAIFHKLDGGRSVRLAKTMIRVTGRSSPAVYVHDEPCKMTLVQNWAKYIAQEQAKTGLQKLSEQGEDNGTTGKPDIQNP